jgi:POT family proton-dependent oligopeptide transporter
VFTGIAIFCVLFGFLVLLIRKKLESLTHGAEDNERNIVDDNEPYELADPDINKAK